MGWVLGDLEDIFGISDGDYAIWDDYLVLKLKIFVLLRVYLVQLGPGAQLSGAQFATFQGGLLVTKMVFQCLGWRTLYFGCWIWDWSILYSGWFI